MEQEFQSNNPLWSPKPICACSGGGKPYDLNGVMVISRDPACRVHITTLSFSSEAVSAERLVSNWNGRERVKNEEA